MVMAEILHPPVDVKPIATSEEPVRTKTRQEIEEEFKDRYARPPQINQELRPTDPLQEVFGGSALLMAIAILTSELSLTPGQEKYQQLADERRALIAQLSEKEKARLVSAG